MYERLTRDLWLAGKTDLEHYRRMMAVSGEMDRRGIGHRCDQIAKDVQDERIASEE